MSNSDEGFRSVPGKDVGTAFDYGKGTKPPEARLTSGIGFMVLARRGHHDVRWPIHRRWQRVLCYMAGRPRRRVYAVPLHPEAERGHG